LEYPVKDIESKYQESSLFVMTSHFEGFGLAIIEAMSCGLPVVSFACNFGPIALVDHNLNGYLVQNGDIKQLADKICLLIDNEDMRLEMGRQARLKAENYRIEHIGKQWENLFAEVIKENRE
jgi:glycosyltransferase involved in cell wall biosynthesis